MGHHRLNTAIIALILCVVSLSGISGNHREEESHPVYTRDFAVELEDDGDETIADLVAGAYGFTVVKRLVNLGNVYYFQHDDVPHRSKRSADDLVGALLKDPNVKSAEQQRLLIRKKRELLSSSDGLLDILGKDTDDHSEDEIKKRILAELKRFEEHLPTDDKRSDDVETDIVEEERSEDSGTAMYNDPLFPNQWYLQEDRRSRRSVKNLDLNLGVVWLQNITGSGVVVTVMDDGLQYTHPDLKKNYDPKASTDLNDPTDKEGDPMPNTKVWGNDHGTKCAGEIAAEANNNVCGIGVAYNCKIGGIRMLDGKITDILESDAISFGIGYIDVYSASWGPSDTGKLMEAPGRYCQKALEAGITKGRDGLGSIYVWATGNGGMNEDNCNCDGYVSSIYTVSIGSVTMNGLSTYYSEVCASTLAVVFTGGPHTTAGIRQFTASPHAVVTTGVDGECTNGFVGTSGAAPLAAGCVALVLEANLKVSWRDVQHIIIESCRIPNGEEMVWTINGAGKHVSHEFGFGMMDCGRMVELAQNWTNVGPQHTCMVQDANVMKVIPSKGTVNMTLRTDGCSDDPAEMVEKLEHVEAIIKLNHTYRGDVKLVLISPAGTHSTILQFRKYDDEDDGINFKFMSVHFWGENPTGVWTLMVTDKSGSWSRINHGRIFHFSLILYGTSAQDSTNANLNLKKRDATAHKADRVDMDNIMLQEKRTTNNVRIKRIVRNPDVKDIHVVPDQIESGGIDEKSSGSHTDLVRKILSSIAGRIPESHDKEGLVSEVGEDLSLEKKELKQLSSGDIVKSDSHEKAIQVKRTKLLEALRMNGYTKEDLIRAIEALLVKVQAKIKEKTDLVQVEGDESVTSQSTAQPSDVDSGSTEPSVDVKGDEKIHLNSDIKSDVNGVDSHLVGSLQAIIDGITPTVSSPSATTTDNQEGGGRGNAAGPSQDSVKENLIKDLKKMLEEWHEETKPSE